MVRKVVSIAAVALLMGIDWVTGYSDWVEGVHEQEKTINDYYDSLALKEQFDKSYWKPVAPTEPDLLNKRTAMMLSQSTGSVLGGASGLDYDKWYDDNTVYHDPEFIQPELDPYEDVTLDDSFGAYTQETVVDPILGFKELGATLGSQLQQHDNEGDISGQGQGLVNFDTWWSDFSNGYFGK